MSYLLGLTLGPVQSYIQESRKIRDLHNSSRIISNIMLEVINYIKDNSTNYELIYPNYKNVETLGDCSNYMVFQIESIINVISLENYICKNTEMKIEIFKEAFHLFWAIEEIVDDEYNNAYEKLIRNIRSLKNTYEFDQLEATEQISAEKCSICNKRNIVELNEKDRTNYMLIEDENLCNVCLFKRRQSLDLNNSTIKSIYEISIGNWEKLHSAEIKGLKDDLDQIFKEKAKFYNKDEISNLIFSLKKIKLEIEKKFRKEDAILYSEFSLNNLGRLFKENKNVLVYKKIKEIMKELNNGLLDFSIKEIVRKMTDLSGKMEKIYKKIEGPNYEYCFIQFDIDNLGRWISGAYLSDGESIKDYQKNISNILIRFGLNLREKLKKTECEIIYSGGDDFLGVLPTEECIRVFKIIDNLFDSEVKQKIKEQLKIESEISYSTSITIAQCKDTMNYALRKTRLELENIKNRFKDKVPSKNGVAVSYLINNGKEITSYLKKDEFEILLERIKDLNEIKKSISFSYINNLENEIKTMNYEELSFEEIRSFCAVIDCELKRLMLRSVVIKDAKVIEYIDEMIGFVKKLIPENIIEKATNVNYIEFKNIINTLKIKERLSKINYNLEKGDINGTY